MNQQQMFGGMQRVESGRVDGYVIEITDMGDDVVGVAVRHENADGTICGVCDEGATVWSTEVEAGAYNLELTVKAAQRVASRVWCGVERTIPEMLAAMGLFTLPSHSDIWHVYGSGMDWTEDQIRTSYERWLARV